MLEILVVSIGIVLIIEGLLYFFISRNLKLVTEQLNKLNPKSLKNFGLIIALIGFCLIYYIIKFYNE
tara:strand:+ start:294 stop:494 length:201 start_codon:yes stop_codon:yes gene_type:complete